MSARILIAQDPKVLDVTKQALLGYDVLIATTKQQAEYLVVEDGIDLFLIGIHFDESRGVELASFIRRDSKHATTPIIMARLISTPNAEILRSVGSVLVKTGKLNQYLDFDKDPDMTAKIRLAVESHLPAEKVCRTNLHFSS